MHAAKWGNKRVHLFSFQGRVRMEFFLIILFPSCSPWCYQVLNGYQLCSPRAFPIAPHFISYPLPKVLPFVTYIGEPKGRHIEALFWEAHTFQIFSRVRGWSKWPIAKEKKKKTKLGQQTPLMNRRVSNLCLRIWNCHLLGSALIWKELMR